MFPLAVVRAYYAALSAADAPALDQVLAPDFVQHIAGRTAGRRAVAAYAVTYRAAFPDLACEVEPLVVHEDRVAVRTTSRGTHRTAFMGHPATQRGFTATGLDVFRVADGRLAEQWGEFDTFGMLCQLGIYGGDRA